jgi:hypothetical protein
MPGCLCVQRWRRAACCRTHNWRPDLVRCTLFFVILLRCTEYVKRTDLLTSTIVSFVSCTLGLLMARGSYTSLPLAGKPVKTIRRNSDGCTCRTGVINATFALQALKLHSLS